MKPIFPINRFLPVSAFAICVAASSATQAATISAGTATLVVANGSTSSYNLSVFDGKASYRPNGAGSSTTLGDGTLVDYRFATSTTGLYNTYASKGANRISTYVSHVNPQNTYISDSVADDSWVNLWTSNDPGTNFSSVTPNYNDAAITHARANRAAGTIDISGLSSGTLYFVHGNFLSGTAFSLTMSGVGETDVNQTFNIAGGVNTNRGWITEFDFDTTNLDYDTISFTYATDDTVTRGRFMGVMLDGIPEPSSALMVVGSLFGLSLRRKR